MDVKTVCLGMLTDGDASGYDLKKYFESTFGHFFAAGFGSIYPALASLADSGLVTCRVIPQEGKPVRKVYSITDRGREELMHALDNPAPGHKVRSEFLAMMSFAHLMSPDQINDVLNHRLGEIDEFLRMFESLDEGEIESWPKGARFVAGCGKAIAETCKQYIEKNREMLTESDLSGIRSASG